MTFPVGGKIGVVGAIAPSLSEADPGGFEVEQGDMLPSFSLHEGPRKKMNYSLLREKS